MIEAQKGFLSAIGAFLTWGLLPIYWKWFSAISAEEVVIHRVIWTLGFAQMVLFLRRRLQPDRIDFAVIDKLTLLKLFVSGALIGTNWFFFVVAVQTGRVLEASLGYFIGPLVTLLLGHVFLREFFSLWQRVAVALAGMAVFNLLWWADSFPWIELVVAFTFAGYGLVRKVAKVEMFAGLSVEMLFLMPFSLTFLFGFQPVAEMSFGQNLGSTMLLMSTGIATAVPLLLFASGTKRLALSTMGILQFISPTCFFVLGVAVYHEPIPLELISSFGLIWVGVGIYLWQMRNSDANLRKTQA
jgi:chloramphenicol-sensitive protein RarD